MEIGDVIGARYVLQRAMARSSESELFEAQHVHTKRRVAIKLLIGDARLSSNTCKDLLREAEFLTQARHRCLVEVLDAGDDGAVGPFVVTEMLDGRALDGVLAVRRTLSVRQAMAVAIATADALGKIHEIGLVHGRLSPANVFLPAPRTAGPGDIEPPPAKLFDLGMSPNPTSLVEGALAGLAYAAPEALTTDEKSPQLDVYGLAAVAFECLTGEPPQAGDANDARGERPETPAALAKVLMQALSDPQARHADGAKLASALRAALAAEPPPAEEGQHARRTTPRANYATPVLIIRGEHAPVEGRSEDISEGGLLVVSQEPLAPRERVNISFALPLSFEHVTAAAVVRWTKEAREGAKASGLQFVDPSGEILEDIREFVTFFGGALV